MRVGSHRPNRPHRPAQARVRNEPQKATSGPDDPDDLDGPQSTFPTRRSVIMPSNILFERYRPKHIAEVVLLPSDRKTFERFIAKGNAPHILLIGPPGVGKTSVALALANDLNWRVMRMNAAAYTNIEAVRTEIAQFALPPTHGPLPFVFEDDQRHRCVFLDEADHILKNAQAALRGIMEAAAEANHCNFILTANDAEKIDPAIRSRCAVFDFSHSDRTGREIIELAYRERIANIFDTEGFEADPEVIDRLIRRHFPDLRAILNEIQKHV